MIRPAFAVVILAFPLSALAFDDYPLNGLVYNTKDVASLQYRCSLQSRDELHCKFFQTRVRLKMKPEEAKKDVERFVKEYRKNPDPTSAEQCKGARDTMDVLEGRKPAPRPDELTSMTDFEKREYIQLFKLMIEDCTNPSVETYRRFLEFANDIKTRTCVASTWDFEQTFKRVSDVAGKRHTWVVRSEPSGACGVVELSRWEPEKSKYVGIQWNYFAKKAVTNRKGEGLLGMSCADFDEDEYEYNWKSKTRRLQCDYIEFSVL